MSDIYVWCMYKSDIERIRWCLVGALELFILSTVQLSGRPRWSGRVTDDVYSTGCPVGADQSPGPWRWFSIPVVYGLYGPREYDL